MLIWLFVLWYLCALDTACCCFVAGLSLFCRCVVAVFIVAALSLFCRCVVVVLSLFWCCLVVVLLLVAVLSLRCRCVVLSLFCRCFVAVLSLFCPCVVAVLSLPPLDAAGLQNVFAKALRRVARFAKHYS